MKTSSILTTMIAALALAALPAGAATSPHSQAVMNGTLIHDGANSHGHHQAPATSTLSGLGYSWYPQATKAQDKPTTAKAEYPLDTCIVLGNKLGDKAVDYTYNGRHARFCCKGCIDTFKKDPSKYLSKLDAADQKAAKSKDDAKHE